MTSSAPSVPENSPDRPALLAELAESAFSHEHYDEAIRLWQAAIGSLQDSAPQTYFDRLDLAYQRQVHFPLASPEFEVISGEIRKHDFIRDLHDRLRPKKYLEIGVESGISFLLADCAAIGVDPMPRPNIELQQNHRLLRMTSDAFFAHGAEQYLKPGPDLTFIDGMHLFEFALRDFINVEKNSGSNNVVIIDDIFPGHPRQAERERRTRYWTGDVWRVLEALGEYRPDLDLTTLDLNPTGLMVVRDLDPSNTVLEDHYPDVVREMASRALRPEIYVERRGALNPKEWIDAEYPPQGRNA